MRLRWVLAVSLAVNVFLVGFIGVQAWRLRHLRASAVVESVFKQVGERLPPDDRSILRRALQSKAPALIAAGRQSKEALEQVRADVGREPYDDAKVRTDLAAARDARQRMGALVEEILLETLPQLSEAGRKTIGDFRVLAR